MRVSGLGFRGLRLRVWGFWFRVRDLGFGVSDLGLTWTLDVPPFWGYTLCRTEPAKGRTSRVQVGFLL